MTLIRIIGLIGLLLLAACKPGGPTATVLRFIELEGGVTPVNTRMLVSAEMLRIDDGEQSDGYILFDRRTRTIYSVSHASRSVFVVKPKSVTLTAPSPFVHRVVAESSKLPAIAGHPIVQAVHITNGKVCAEVFAAKGLLPDAVAALRAYAEAQAGEQAESEVAKPADLQSDCDLAEHVFTPGRHLDHGFPVRLNRPASGHTRQLGDYREGVPVSPSQFEVPAAYRKFQRSDMVGK